MANAVVPNVAERTILDALKAQEGTDFVVHLYQNNVTPGQASVLGDFTECTFDGYASQQWILGTPFTDGANKANYAPFLGTWTGPEDLVSQNVYGWYVTNGANSKLLMAARFADAPRVMDDPDDTIIFTVTFKEYDAHQ